jgi:hypothetical protein
MISVALALGIPVVDELRELVTISEGASTENRTHEIGFEHFAGSLDTTAHHTRDSRVTRPTRAAQKEALDFRAGTHAHRARLGARHFDSVGRTARRAREAFLADWADRFLTMCSRKSGMICCEVSMSCSSRSALLFPGTR